jgi:hypothetical protein
MKELCRNSGIALVLIPELPKTRLSGNHGHHTGMERQVLKGVFA